MGNSGGIVSESPMQNVTSNSLLLRVTGIETVDKHICINEEGRTFVIRAGDKYEEVESNDLGEMALATPALVGDRLILRTDKHLYSIRNTRGNKVH